MALHSDELVRYSRHLRLGEVGQEGQERLRDARVLVVGLGGLGSPVSLYLAAAGVGTLGLADFDRVELHNLQRQVVHGEGSVGRSKLESAVESLRSINSTVSYRLHGEGVTLANAVSLFGEYDVIVDGTDNFPTRYLNNDAAFLARKPLVYGSIFQFEGQVSVFDPASGAPCYRCLFPQMPEPGSVPNCDQAGVLGALCGVVGSYQALEAVKLILGIGEPLRGRLLVVDTLAQRHSTIRIKRDPGCPLCGDEPVIRDLQEANYRFACEADRVESAGLMQEQAIEVSVEEARKMRDEAVFLDVRESFEVAICRIDGARHIPMKEVTQRHSELPKDKPLVVYCHHGMRSLRVTEYLRAQGFTQVSSMRGGIDAWAVTYDPQMARY